jgi:hypothetical protein
MIDASASNQCFAAIIDIDPGMAATDQQFVEVKYANQNECYLIMMIINIHPVS